MKPILLLLAVLTSASVAFAQQDTCSNTYGSCADRCVQRPQSTQDSCLKACELASNQCYDRMYGRRAPDSVLNVPSAQDSPAGANAKADAGAGSKTR